ncbi:hypothetical protein AB837_00018 [bacterium AB1]|nr:hypothetical protein AB837_00018 [bacterium AB1]
MYYLIFIYKNIEIFQLEYIYNNITFLCKDFFFHAAKIKKYKKQNNYYITLIIMNKKPIKKNLSISYKDIKYVPKTPYSISSFYKFIKIGEDLLGIKISEFNFLENSKKCFLCSKSSNIYFDLKVYDNVFHYCEKCVKENNYSLYTCNPCHLCNNCTLCFNSFNKYTLCCFKFLLNFINDLSNICSICR